MIGWWFADGSRRLRNGDNRKIRVGKTHRVKGPIMVGAHGLHASERAIDALLCAPVDQETRAFVYRVELHGRLSYTIAKACARQRTYLDGGMDATETLRGFLRWCALQVAHLWNCPKVIMEYLETGDEEIWLEAEKYMPGVKSAADFAADAAYAAIRDENFSDVIELTEKALVFEKKIFGYWDFDEARDALNAELERRLYALISAE